MAVTTIPQPRRDCYGGGVTEPGFYVMSAEAYHRDPCPSPSLSASAAIRLISNSARHAWAEHPRLNRRLKPRRPTAFMEDGSCVHRLLTGQGPIPLVVDATDWTTSRARNSRLEAQNTGRPAVLARRWMELRRIAATAKAQILASPELPGDWWKGFGEAVLIWQEGGIWCRCMVDWLMPWRGAPMVDFKLSSRFQSVDDVGRKIGTLGYEIRQHHYRRGLKAVFGFDPGPYVYVTIEAEQPHGVTYTTSGLAWQERGRMLWERAAVGWAVCLRTQTWPGYSNRLQHLEMPQYEEEKMLNLMDRAEQQMRTQIPGSDLNNMRKAMHLDV